MYVPSAKRLHVSVRGSELALSVQSVLPGVRSRSTSRTAAGDRARAGREPFHALDGAKPGTSLASADRLKLGKSSSLGSTTGTSPVAASNGVLKARDGIIQEVGIANKGLTATRAAQARLLTNF